MVTTRPARARSTSAPYPEPDPTSSTLSLGWSWAASAIIATIAGWLMVCPSPMGRGPSSYAAAASRRGTKLRRGTVPMAASTASSRTP